MAKVKQIINIETNLRFIVASKEVLQFFLKQHNQTKNKIWIK